ncbi:MAG: ASPIC/UnbV domain-containing protein [Acidobacteriota bacterium]
MGRFLALVKVVTGSLEQKAQPQSGGSYLSQSDPRLHFGLGKYTHIDRIEVHWPGGAKTVLRDQSAGREITVRQARRR